jgi:ribosomal protein L11 methyltransferase
LNHLAGVRFALADACRAAPNQHFDFLTANLYSQLLVDGLSRWRRLVRPGGELILSGILRSQEREVCAALVRSKLEVKTIRRRPKWIAILAAKPP